MLLMCLASGLFIAPAPALSFDSDVDEYYGENLIQPFILNISVPEGAHKLVKVSQQRGDVVLELEDGPTQQVVKSVDCLLYTSPSPRDS